MAKELGGTVMERTIIYYTANKETFEDKIVENLLKHSGGLPIVSVSKKPMNLGTNICVGETPHSYTSEFMQIRLGLEAITTPYVLTAESDFLYPPEYFQYVPMELGKCYRYYGVWVATDKFYMKGCSDGAQLIDRLLWLDLINTALPSRDDWNQPMLARCQPGTDYNLTWTGNPAITFKTSKNINRATQVKSDIIPVLDLPFWGNINNLT